MKAEPNKLNEECVAIPISPLFKPMKDRIKSGAAQVIRVLTAPPLMAGALLLLLRQAGYFNGASLWIGLLFLTGLPLLAYPVWLVVPHLLIGGRDSQRKTAVVFSVIGYLGGAAYCLFGNIGRIELIVFLTYLLSGVLIAVCTKVLKYKSSGHACGVAGPIAVLVYTGGLWWLFGLLLLGAVVWSSLRMKRHTMPQLLVGAASSVLSFMFWLALI